MSKAFGDAARALESQAVLVVERPSGVAGAQDLVVTGTAGGQPFEAVSSIDLGDTAPVVVTTTPSSATTGAAAAPPSSLEPLQATRPAFLVPAVLLLTVGVFLLVLAFAGPVFRSRRAERVAAVELYGFATPASRQRQAAAPSALTEQLIHAGDRVMEGRESTTRTMALIDRADLPWRAGEWFVLRLLAVIVGGLLGYLILLGRSPVLGLALGVLVGFVVPSMVLRFLARRRASAFEAALPDVLMLVATSLSSGFSLLQALDAVAKDAAEPCAKEFSRALAETRIGADVSDALEHMADRMDSDNMRWTTMAIRIQRDVGGNLAETLRTTAATLREREMLKRQVRALSAEGRLSAYILIALPILLFVYMLAVNYEYVSLLWTTLIGVRHALRLGRRLVVGVFWMRKVVEIEV